MPPNFGSNPSSGTEQSLVLSHATKPLVRILCLQPTIGTWNVVLNDIQIPYFNLLNSVNFSD